MKIIISEDQYNRVIWQDQSSDMSIQDIKDMKEYIERFLPKILKYFKSKYKNDLVKIDLETKNVLFGHEDFIMEIPLITFYFSESVVNRSQEILNDLKNYFSIDMKKYGIPLSIRVYEQTWKRVYG
jgi:hypothetical protein